MIDVIARAQHGDIEARDLVLQQYMDVVMREARHFGRQRADVDDLIQEGSLAVLRALGKFNPDRGEFRHYVLRSVRNAMRDHYNEKKKRQEDTGLDEDVVAAEIEDGPRQLPPSLLGWIDGLSRIEKQMVYLTFGAKDDIERTPQDVAAIYDQSPWSVYKKLEKLKTAAREVVLV